MKPLMEATTARRLLERGIANGWWSIEDIDRPSQGFKLATESFSPQFGRGLKRLCGQTAVRRLRMSRISSDAVSALWFPEHANLNDEHHTRIDGHRGSEAVRAAETLDHH